MSDTPTESSPSWGRRLLTVAAVGGIALITVLVIGIIQLTEPEAEKEGAVKKTAALVEVVEAEVGDYQPQLRAMGVVRPSQDVMLEPRVSGQVLQLAPEFVPGRVVPEGTPLLRIDPADARQALAQRRAELQQTEAELALEKGRQAVAKVEREQIDAEITAEQEALVLRGPQLQVAEAAVASARAAVRQAELNLQRTEVTAPFDALILERSAHTGSQVAPGNVLGRVVATDTFWVELTLPSRKLGHLSASGAAPEVRLRDRSAWGEDVERVGRLETVVQQVDDQTRMARLLVVVDDPLALEPDTEGPPLAAGAWVEAHVAASPLYDVVRLPRELLRRNDTVWVMTDGSLDIRDVDVVLEDARYAYLRDGLQAGERVVTTDLATVTDGAPLRTESP